MQQNHSQQSLPILLLITLISLFISGCSSNSGTQGDGELVISLTDAEGDFLSYTVDVVSLKITKQNGAEVETLPLTTTLDFSQYVDVTEFLTAATVPSGIYTGAQITLDYSNANITVQDENGTAISANAVDTNGNPITQLTVDISLNGGSEFIIAPGIPAHITLDFDLDASNVVSINNNSATIVVSPLLIADTILEEPKPHRLRGLLRAVNEIEKTFNVAMRPFRHQLSRFGNLTAHTNDRTSFEIDGRMYSGDAGLTALSNLSPASAVVVIGEVNNIQRQFKAIEVYAGSSVPWGNKDIVSGNVIARSADTLVIRGATIIRTDGSFSFNDNVTVNLTDDTSVVKQTDTTNVYTKDDISVGQRITVLGNLDSRANLNINASHVRMHYTRLSGTVVSVSPLAVNLQGIDRRRIMLFDFSGTGSDAINNADTNNYEVDSGALSLSNLQNGDPVKVIGFVRSFGQAPEDFSAQTIVDVSRVAAHLAVTYASGSVNAVTSISETGIQLNLTEAGNVHHLYRAGVATNLLDLISMPLIAPKDNGKGLFVIARGIALRVYSNYSVFQQALNTVLDGTTAILSVHSHGVYNTDENTLTARNINVRLTTE